MSCENPKIIAHLPQIIDRGESANFSIHIGKGECQKYLFIPEKDGIYERHITVEDGSVFRGGAIVLGANMVLKMTVSIIGGKSDASLKLLGLAKDHAKIEICGIGKVEPECENVRLRVDQTNIILGKHVVIRGKPVLEVATDSIEGGHSCKIHEISKEKLFYLESHGIDTTTAEGMLLEGEINHHIQVLEKNEGLKDAILERIISRN